MALNITLNICNKDGINPVKPIFLYFGKALQGSWDGWKWVEEQGFTVEGPWAFDKGNEPTYYKVSKSQLIDWIKQGFLSLDGLGGDTSFSFLDSFNEDCIFTLSFTDWS